MDNVGGDVLHIFFASNNQAKLNEVKQILEPLGFEVENLEIDFQEPSFGTIEEVALNKLDQILEKGYDQVIVDDSGIFFKAYHQFPGILTKRIFHHIGYVGIKKLLEGESREAWFKGTLALSWKGEKRIFSGILKGVMVKDICEETCCEPGLPFDPIFIPVGSSQTLKKMSIEERLFYSYRRPALEEMVKWIWSRK